MKSCSTNAFTVAELVMGLAIASLIGLSVAGVSAGLSNAEASSREYFQSAQTARSVLNQNIGS